MLYAHIDIAEKYDYLEERFGCAYRWLRESDLSSLAVGSYPIMGDKVVANVQEYTTHPAADSRFESHERYFDIQYMVSGREQFGICGIQGLTVESRDQENDMILYEEPTVSGSVLLCAGDLAVVAPEDAHKPRCMADGPEPVKKVVVKVAI